jgi:hypothetical protein
MSTQPTDNASDQRSDSTEEVDQDSEPTNTAPPGERPSDPGPIAEASGSDTGDE